MPSLFLYLSCFLSWDLYFNLIFICLEFFLKWLLQLWVWENTSNSLIIGNFFQSQVPPPPPQYIWFVVFLGKGGRTENSQGPYPHGAYIFSSGLCISGINLFLLQEPAFSKSQRLKKRKSPLCPCKHSYLVQGMYQGGCPPYVVTRCCTSVSTQASQMAATRRESTGGLLTPPWRVSAQKNHTHFHWPKNVMWPWQT